MSRSDIKPEADGAKAKTSSSSFSMLAALFFLLAIGLWMGSGTIVIGGSDTDKVTPLSEHNKPAQTGDASAKDIELFKVRARRFKAAPRRASLHVRARTKAIASVAVRAETAGRVLSISARKGRFVKQDEVLCALDEGARRATLAKAEARVEQTKADYDVSRRLALKGASAKLKVISQKALYDGALADLKQARIDLDNTKVKAPFGGLVQEQPAKTGDYLAPSGICAKLVKLHPLLITGEVSERNITQMKRGQTARAELVTGEKVNGKISYISSSSDPQTRTFTIEMQVANRKRQLRDGVTADIHIPLAIQKGHHLSPGLLTLSDAGMVGVRLIDDKQMVRFAPVKILDQDASGVWVKGLPDTVTIITAGQDYVVAGQKVEVIMEPENGEKGRKNVRS